MERSGYFAHYLGKCWGFLLAIFLKFDRVPRIVSPSERISRFIFYRGHIDEINHLVKYAAFLPSRRANNISVYRTGGCSERKIWWIGVLFVEKKRTDKLKLLARADAQSCVFSNRKLTIVAHSSPHARHAEVTNWPDDNRKRKAIAMVLAQEATLATIE